MCQALSRPGSRKSAVSPCASGDLARCNIEVNDRSLSRAGRATAGVKTVRYSRAFQAGRQHAAAAAILAPHGAQYLPNGAGPGRPPTRRWRISQCASSVARAGPSICMGPPDRARRQGPVVKRFIRVQQKPADCQRERQLFALHLSKVAVPHPWLPLQRVPPFDKLMPTNRPSYRL